MNLPPLPGWTLFAWTLAFLALATLAGQFLRLRARSDTARLSVANLNLRIASWWVLCAAVGTALILGEPAVLAVFALFSLLAQRELLALLPGHPARRSAVFACAAILTLGHYAILGTRGMAAFPVFLPLAGFPAICLVQLPGGGRFFDRVARAYASLLLCSWCLSCAPALLALEIPGYPGRNPELLFYLLLVTESSDVFQYLFGTLFGRLPLAPRLSPRKTWEGFLGGIGSATALGAGLYRATPFSPAEAAFVCLAATLAGVAGGLVLSAVKRNAGIKDFGALVPGHGGILDRADSLAFAAPVFLALVRWRVRF